MDSYNKILTNKNYVDIVNKIENIKFITDGKWDWDHGLGHYKRVASYAECILKQLGADDRTIELAKVAALLHDIGLSESGINKKDHALISSHMFRNYLEGLDITNDEQKVLENAIKDHSRGDDIKSLVGLVLVLSDKLDVTYHRTINSSIQDKMNKEIQKIKKVDINITKKSLTLNYMTENNFDISVLKNWDKAITIPYKMALKLNLDFVFMINNHKNDISAFID